MVLKARVMPCLLVKEGALVKTQQFSDPGYVGDPINAIRIYNEKEVDELILLDITATINGSPPSFQLITEVSNECFMPICYGGGIRTIDQAKIIFNSGVEKVAINTMASEDPTFIRRLADRFGSQSIVVSMDVRMTKTGYEVFVRGGRQPIGKDPITYAKDMEFMGAGELLLNSIELDGMMSGMDLQLIQSVTSSVHIPVIAIGGAGCLEHIRAAIADGGASAVALGSMAVYHGRDRAVLINFPKRDELRSILEPPL